MSDAVAIADYRLRMINHFKNSGLSQRAWCRLPNTPSRATLRKWLRRYEENGSDGLLSKKPDRLPHNRASLKDEAHILDYVRKHPAHGAQRIANELRSLIAVGHTGVHGVLSRHRLNKRKLRIEWTRIQNGEVVTKSELERAREKAKQNHFQIQYAGECFGLDSFCIGRIKGVGTIYHFLGVDIHSRFAVAKIYPDRKARSAIDFLDNALRPKAKGLGIHRLVLDNGTEFTAARWRDELKQSNHPFEALARSLGIRLSFIKPGHPWTNGACERLHQTLLYEFYIPAFTSKIYTSIEELDYDLQLFMAWYNFLRSNQSYRLKGKTPAQLYFDGSTPRKDFFLQAA